VFVRARRERERERGARRWRRRRKRRMRIDGKGCQKKVESANRKLSERATDRREVKVAKAVKQPFTIVSAGKHDTA
jgi:hypothetical protein